MTACGFQLRGASDSSLRAIHLAPSGEFAPTRRAFQSAFTSRGINTGAADPGVASVTITDERSVRRSVATTALMNAAEYELRMEVDVVIAINGQVTEATLVTERVFSLDALNLSGSYEEQTMALGEMRDELARRLIRRVEALVANPSSLTTATSNLTIDESLP